MPRNRIGSKAKERYRLSMRDVIKGLGRKIKVYKQPVKKECTNCFYDKLTNSSTGKCKWTATEAISKQLEFEQAGGTSLTYKFFRVGRCPICQSKGYTEVQRHVWIDCLVTWNPNEDSGNSIMYTPAGTEGSSAVRLKTDPKYVDIFKNCSRLVVDGVECKLSKPPIIRGLGNQTTLIIIAFTTDKPSIDSGEIIKDY